MNRRVAFAAAGGLLFLGAVILAGLRQGDQLALRLLDLGSNGRDLVWANTLSAIQSAPLSGVGPYLLGRHLQPPNAYCELWIGPGSTATCPEWLGNLGSPWLIAHNGVLQQLAETGPLGLVGLFALIGVVLYTAWRAKDALGIAILVGLVIATLPDNTLLVPSPFFAELFWIVAGIQLLRVTELNLTQGIMGATALAFLSLPIWVSAFAAQPTLKAELIFLRAPEQIATNKDYKIYGSLKLPSGGYRLLLQSCTQSCTTVSSRLLQARENTEANFDLNGEIRAVSAQNLQLRLYPERSGANAVPLLHHAWSVRLFK